MLRCCKVSFYQEGIKTSFTGFERQKLVWDGLRSGFEMSTKSNHVIVLILVKVCFLIVAKNWWSVITPLLIRNKQDIGVDMKQSKHQENFCSGFNATFRLSAFFRCGDKKIKKKAKNPYKLARINTIGLLSNRIAIRFYLQEWAPEENHCFKQNPLVSNLVLALI